MRVTPFLCRLHRSAFRYTGRVTDNGRHNQDIGVMLLPAGGLNHLGQAYALWAFEQLDQGDVWNVKKPAKNDLHPTMKPVELVERAIRNSSKSRDLVLDPFGGSGSTLIACEKSGRRARLIELDPKYVDVIVKRWEEFTGKKATRLGEPADEALAEIDQAEIL